MLAKVSQIIIQYNSLNKFSMEPNVNCFSNLYIKNYKPFSLSFSLKVISVSSINVLYIRKRKIETIMYIRIQIKLPGNSIVKNIFFHKYRKVLHSFPDLKAHYASEMNTCFIL
jgi:hypothetical protein